MGWLKKHLNPNPIKQVKNTLSDVKKVAKVVAKVDPVARTAMKLDPIARKVTGVGAGRKRSPTPSPVSPQRGVYQGNAPAPRPVIIPLQTPIIRKSPTRSNMSTLGAGKYRIK